MSSDYITLIQEWDTAWEQIAASRASTKMKIAASRAAIDAKIQELENQAIECKRVLEKTWMARYDATHISTKNNLSSLSTISNDLQNPSMAIHQTD